MSTRPLFLFAPGAGAPSDSPWMKRFAAHLSTLGPVEVFDYPYQISGRKYPDRLPVLIEAHKAALERARLVHPGPVVLVGKSMGSRVGCHLSLEVRVAALVCLGYPLLGAGDPNKRRDGVLREVTTPILFVQGTRDVLCPLGELRTLLPELRVDAQLHVVEDGDHSLEARRTFLKRNATTQAQIETAIAAAIAAFVEKSVSAF
jgi:uncharacterized protein